MALYSYSKTKPGVRKKIGSIISLILILTGLTLLVSAIYPIATFELYYAHKYSILASPISEQEELFSNKLTRVLGATFTDFTRASIWFPKATPVIMRQNSKDYSLSIPKLNINNAKVAINGEDLSKSLIQFTGSLPGTIGNPVIFGHSTLLLFYNPKDYKAIFSKLPDLDLGDNITVEVDNVTYVYRIFKMFITSANDLTVLDQNTNEEQLTLVTCVPPGTYLKRFIVKARLEL